MVKLKTGILAMVVAMFVIGMVIVPSVTACSNTPEGAFWGYGYLDAITIEGYGDVKDYLSSACAGGAVASTFCAGCSALRHPYSVAACSVICGVVMVGSTCGTYAIVNWDYTSKNSWLRNNCDSMNEKLVDVYLKKWWNPMPLLAYTNARCGC